MALHHQCVTVQDIPGSPIPGARAPGPSAPHRISSPMALTVPLVMTKLRQEHKAENMEQEPVTEVQLESSGKGRNRSRYRNTGGKMQMARAGTKVGAGALE